MHNKLCSLAIAASLIFTITNSNVCYAKDKEDFTGFNQTEELKPEVDIMDGVDYPGAEYFVPAGSSTPNFIDELVITELNDTIYKSPQAALDAVRMLLNNRAESIEVIYYAGEDMTNLEAANYLSYNIWEDTDNPKLGDYLRWNMSIESQAPKFFEGSVDGRDAVKFEWKEIAYLTNLEQEHEIDDKVSQLLSNTGAIGSQKNSDDYHKVSAIYDYEIDNFAYDHDLADTSHSTYSALIENYTVCQGYATTMYRLAKSLGMSCRVESSETHGWNIVKVDDKYYYVDATWGDNPGLRAKYFLIGSDNWLVDDSHTMTDYYDTHKFAERYPIAHDDYEYVEKEDTATETTTEATSEDTTESTTEGTTEVTTEDTTEYTTTEEKTEIPKEESSSEETASDDEHVYLTQEDGLTIYYDESGANTGNRYETSGEPTVSDWETPAHVNPYYGAEDAAVYPVTPHSANTNNMTTSHGSAASSSTTTGVSSVEAATTEATNSAEAFKVLVNGEELPDSKIYEKEAGIKSLTIEGITDCKMTYYNQTGKKVGKDTISSDTPITAIDIQCDKQLVYAVKTAQLGWLDPVESELTGSLGTDDYLTGIKFLDEYEATEKYTSLVGACREFTDVTTSKLISLVHTDCGWGIATANGGINGEGKYVNAIRINSDSEIKYSVKQGEWLPEVTNRVLAGNPFDETELTGVKISGEGIKFRVLTSEGSWSKWFTSGQSIELDTEFITDIQVFQK